MTARWEIREGDCLERLREMPSQTVQCCVTSPPYFGLRDYGIEGQIGLEATPDEFVAALVGVFAEVRRVLRDDGTVWLNLGDSYAAHGAGAAGKELAYMPTADRRMARSAPDGVKSKDLLGIPWLVAFALRADGWYLRSDIIWHKPNPMPESVTDRPTKAHEYLFLLSKSARYFYDADAIREAHESEGAFRARDTEPSQSRANLSQPQQAGVYHVNGRNKRSVWTVATQPYAGAHFATFPPKLIEPCILAGCPEGGTVLDLFAGAGTTGLVALRHCRSFIGIELNATYATIARERIRQDAPLLNMNAEVAA